MKNFQGIRFHNIPINDPQPPQWRFHNDDTYSSPRCSICKYGFITGGYVEDVDCHKYKFRSTYEFVCDSFAESTIIGLAETIVWIGI
jgi:hypothetical protein